LSSERQFVHVLGATTQPNRSPTARVARVAHNFATDLEGAAGRRLRFLIRGQETKLIATFDEEFASIAVETICTPIRSPRVNDGGIAACPDRRNGRHRPDLPDTPGGCRF
jgi:hypothetical protein